MALDPRVQGGARNVKPFSHADVRELARRDHGANGDDGDTDGANRDEIRRGILNSEKTLFR